MRRIGFALLAAFALLGLWGGLASAQPLIESDITAFRPNLSISEGIVAHRLKDQPGIVDRLPESEADIVAWLPKDSQKNVSRLPNYKVILSGRTINFKQPIVERLPESEAEIVSWRIPFKEPVVAERINFKEEVSWQPADPSERYAR